MFLYNYLSNIVYSDNIERSRKPTQPIPSPIPQQQHHHHHQQQYYYYSSTYSNFHNHTTSAYAAATMNSPNNNNSSNKTPQNRRVIDSEHRYKIVDDICAESNLYNILGVERTCSTEELRRAYISVMDVILWSKCGRKGKMREVKSEGGGENEGKLNNWSSRRSRICHPDKFPEYPKATEAFQKLSYSYETLNKPSSRRAYDISGTSELGNVNGMGDETLHSVLYQLFLEFMDGDFEMIRALVNALNENNPGLNLGDDAIETLEIAFRRMRDLLLAGKKYVKIVQFELIRLYELQQQLRSLSYFDVFGRLRLTMQLTKISLTIPMLIDNAMKAESDALGNKGTHKGLLGDGVSKVISSLITVLEAGEQYV
ncbi:DnaJ-domain-containing protein [Rhizophagus irregularis DAOM 181602=DAOM 197198]|nr:DnaJ-domain-containing protein [Rhizophagus irregularis DAOM 181602=DAOM 197198]